jgi:hypothetical protein
MPEETPDLARLATRLEMILDRLDKLEVQVRGLVTSQTVEAKELVIKDDRGSPRARLEMAQYGPRLTFYDGTGKERLKIGLRTDSSPFFRVEQWRFSSGERRSRRNRFTCCVTHPDFAGRSVLPASRARIPPELS